MRLLVLLPAYNEVQSIADVLASIPRSFDGVTVGIAVIDDGSDDGTCDMATAAGVEVLRHSKRLGLAAAFRTGLAHALRHDADFFVTLDADGQYRGDEIPLLLRTLLREGADLVIGNRQIETCFHMPLRHRIGNSIGSAMLRFLGTTGVQDASSGFRLCTKEFASRLRMTGEHTYTHEMLIQASAGGFTVSEVPITFLPRAHGKSKLVRSVRHHIFRSCGTILRALFLYQPLRKFLVLAFFCLTCSLGLVILAIWLRGQLMLFLAAAVFLILGIQFLLLGVLADFFAAQRRLELERPYHLPHS
jgi:glycosyltransferase involved in cell wall biosynthesis